MVFQNDFFYNYLFNGNLPIPVSKGKKNKHIFQRKLLDKLGLPFSTKKHKLKNKLPKTEFSNNNNSLYCRSHIKSGINHCTKDITMYNRLNVKNANNSIPMYSGET